MPDSKLARSLLIAVLALAAVLRFDGLERLQPGLPEPDPYIELQTRMLREGRAADPERDKGYFAYPTLIARGLALLPEPQATSPGLAAALTASCGDFLRVRFVSALSSLLLVLGTWFLARRFAGPLTALMASVLVTLSLEHLYFSQQARPHAAHASFALLALLAALQLRRRATLGAHLAASALVFLAVSTLHNGAALIGPFVAAYALLGAREWKWTVPALGRSAMRVLLGGALFAALVFAAYTFFYPAAAQLGGEKGFEFGGHNTVLEDYDGSGFGICARILWDWEPGLVVLAALGLVLALAGLASWWRRSAFEQRADLLVVLAYAVPYALFLGAFRETSERFLLPLLPFLACLAGGAIERTARAVPNVARPLVLAAALAVPAYGALQYVRVRGARDTLEQAADFVASHADRARERVVVSAGLALPLFHAEAGLARVRDDFASKQRHWLRYQMAHTPPADAAWRIHPMPGKIAVARDPERARQALQEFLDDSDPDWIVVESSRRMLVVPTVGALREWAAAHGELAATLRGESEAWRFEAPIDYQDVPYLFLRLANARAFGPVIEIYRRRR